MSEGIKLEQILHLTGTLDDSTVADSPRERFREFLRGSVPNVGVLRDYIDTCLRTSGTQYNRALQDLVNHAGTLIGFDVEYGRYQGKSGEVGHDGLWRTGDIAIVVEVKTTDTYSIKTLTLTGYVDALISDGRIQDWDHAMGLYVVGRADSGLSQLENAIVAERRTQQLRIASTGDILSLAELVQDKYLTREEAVMLLRPAGVHVGSVVNLLTRVIAETPEEPSYPLPDPDREVVVMESPAATLRRSTTKSRAATSSDPMHLITPVSDDKDLSAETVIRQLLDSGEYVFGERTPGLKELKPGDRICFYQSRTGVVAEAELASIPERRVSKVARDPERFPWTFRVKSVRYFFDNPVVIDAALRSRLEVFTGKDPNGSWSWLVQGTKRIPAHDFEVLTGSRDN